MKAKKYSIYNVKFLLAFFISTFFSFQLVAQVSLGVKVGATNAWEDYGDLELPENAQIDVNGYYFSVLSYLKINKYLSLGVEPGFVQRGAACVPGWNPFIGDTEFKLNYIELPLMVQGSFSFAGDRFEVFGKVGYGGAIIQQGTETVSFIDSDEPPIKTEIDFQNSFSSLNRFDHGYYLGAEIGFNFGLNRLFLEGNYYNGLRDFDNNNTSKNRSLQFGVGFIRTLNPS